MPDHRATHAHSVYTIDVLMAEGFTRRCIHYYCSHGILPRPHGRGFGARYGEEHIAILRKIKEARDQRRTLRDVAEASRHYFPRDQRRAA
jgi:DNA-binding transcriptional MerR regulator